MALLILASSSFRRRELLKWLGVPFDVLMPSFEESPFSFQEFNDVQSYVQTLSLGKALSVIEGLSEGIVLTADTMVSLGGEVIGKPNNLDHAREILKKLMGRSHDVYTGFTVWDVKKNLHETHLVHTTVWFQEVADDVIEKYVQTGEPLGKAGAYGLQGNAKVFLDHLEGSMTNVIGLPLVEVSETLEHFGVKILVNVPKTIHTYLQVNS